MTEFDSTFQKFPFFGWLDLTKKAVLLILVGGLPTAISWASDNPKDHSAAWAKASALLINEANEAFTKASKKDKTNEPRLGQALTLLNVQPKTEENIENASLLLKAILAETPSEEITIQALYFLGRIEEVHRFKPDWDKASEFYSRLFSEHPTQLLGQIAFVKNAALKIYSDSADKNREDLLKQIERTSSFLTHPDALRDFHFLMAKAYFRFGYSNQLVLKHLSEAEKAGILRGTTRRSVYLQLANFSEELGLKAQALAYYRKFLDSSVQDGRTFTVRQKISILEGKPQ